VSKIFILSQAEVLPTLEKFIDIENIPSIYGGKLDFKWGDLPQLETEIADTLEWTDTAAGVRAVPLGPLRWRPSASNPGRLELVLVGTDQGKPREKVVAQTKPEIDTKTMTGFPGVKATNEPIDWSKEETGAPLDAKITQEPVEKAELELEQSGVNVETIGEDVKA
jgi:hypothetical protein